MTETSGIGCAYGPGLGVFCADFNGDGRPDIYVANDTAANLLWLNQGQGMFREARFKPVWRTTQMAARRREWVSPRTKSMARGMLHISLTNLTREGATLFRGNSKGVFEDVTAQDSA